MTAAEQQSSPQESATVERGDFTRLAADYVHRPGYDRKLLHTLAHHVGAFRCDGRDFVVADVGAGTGKLSLDLHACGLATVAVEPNDAMRAEGQRQTAEIATRWRKGSGEATTLDDASVDWVLMASSFHWVDLHRGLDEFFRVLRPGGYFTALWNPRNIAASPLHRRIEARIEALVPGLSRVSSGARKHTQDWAAKLRSTGQFDGLLFMESEYELKVPRSRYMGAWRSVNDIQSQAGPERFAEILAAIEAELGELDPVPVPYATRAWTVQRRA